ncbi:hypothetical protein Ahy_A01g000070 [Arachis hypogaea]|uniref:BED-type domain-containing protein n=1 Tax=Arachis hypogaea TaxID=3818 RepID=A0A445EJB0_ARAHY|nr:hypothetical protein Ahy_A01g000070 [Arachis hypogaea]
MDNPFSMEVDSGNVTQNPENMETSETAEDIKKKKTKATTSDVWRYFTKLGPSDDGIDRAQCDGCKQKFKAGGKQYGTSSLKRHLDSGQTGRSIFRQILAEQSRVGQANLLCHLYLGIFYRFRCGMGMMKIRRLT